MRQENVRLKQQVAKMEAASIAYGDLAKQELSRSQESGSQNGRTQKITVVDRTYLAYDNGTALDTKTGLLWMRCLVGRTWNGNTCMGEAKKFNWEEARQQTAVFAGYSDWRIPTIEELRTLVYCSNGEPDYFNNGKPDFEEYNAPDRPNNFDWGCRGKPGEDHEKPTIVLAVFPNTPSSVVWSCSPYASSLGDAWHVNFGSGDGSGSGYRYDYNHVRLVRDGQ
jgi:hypothetical protein